MSIEWRHLVLDPNPLSNLRRTLVQAEGWIFTTWRYALWFSIANTNNLQHGIASPRLMLRITSSYRYTKTDRSVGLTYLVIFSVTSVIPVIWKDWSVARSGFYLLNWLGLQSPHIFLNSKSIRALRAVSPSGLDKKFKFTLLWELPTFLWSSVTTECISLYCLYWQI
jgi:hypothetical protein